MERIETLDRKQPSVACGNLKPMLDQLSRSTYKQRTNVIGELVAFHDDICVC